MKRVFQTAAGVVAGIIIYDAFFKLGVEEFILTNEWVGFGAFTVASIVGFFATTELGLFLLIGVIPFVTVMAWSGYSKFKRNLIRRAMPQRAALRYVAPKKFVVPEADYSDLKRSRIKRSEVAVAKKDA